MVRLPSGEHSYDVQPFRQSTSMTGVACERINRMAITVAQWLKLGEYRVPCLICSRLPLILREFFVDVAADETAE